MTSITPTRRITPKHAEVLAASAISLEAAQAWGIFSVVSADELPADLAHFVFARGLVFPLRRPDGSVIHQIRMDEPSKDHGKYLQPGGTGSVINIPESMKDRVGKVTKILVTEGTKQTIAACLYAPEDTLVVGIQGCRNFSLGGVPLEVWSQIVNPDDEVTICFDADWTTNPDVWAAARDLKGHLEGMISAKVELATVPGGGKLGLDDALGVTLETNRARAVVNLISAAKAALGRQPRRNTHKVAYGHASEIIVDMEAGQIRRTVGGTASSSGSPRTPEVLLFAAARIVEFESVIDEHSRHSSMLQLTLQVAVRVDGQRLPEVHSVKIPSSRLANTGEWLDMLPHGLGGRVPRDTRPNDEIANAIRTAESASTHVTVLPRLGWYYDDEAFMGTGAGDDEAGMGTGAGDEERDNGRGGVWRWCDGKGAIGPDGKVTHLRGRPSAKDYQAIDLDDPSSLDPATTRQRLRDFILTRELLNDEARFYWDVAIAGWALSFLGITPNAALAYFGPPSSGKSTIAQAIASTLSTAWAPRAGSAMATFNARPAGMDLLANGMSHCFLHVDDLKPESDQQSMKNALKAFDALLRRSHGSGGAVRGGIDKNSDSLIVRGVDNSSPFVIVTGEEIPTGGDFAESGLDRALIIPIEPRSLFGDNTANLATLERRASSGEFKTVTAVYLRWIAQRIDARVEVAEPERFGAWKAALDATRTGMAEATSKKGKLPDDLRVSDRARLLAGSLLLGMQMLLECALSLDAVDVLEAEAIAERFEIDLVRAVKDHTRAVMGGNVTVEVRALSILRSAVSSGQVSLDSQETPHRPLIGERKVLPGGEEVIAINIRAAADALRYVGGDRALMKALSKVVLLDGKGGTTRTLLVNRIRVQAVCIRASAWDGDDPLTVPVQTESSH